MIKKENTTVWEEIKGIHPLIPAIIFAALLTFSTMTVLNFYYETEHGEANIFCQEEGYEKGTKEYGLWKNNGFFFKCSKIIEEKHCLEGYCEVYEEEQTGNFWSAKEVVE